MNVPLPTTVAPTLPLPANPPSAQNPVTGGFMGLLTNTLQAEQTAQRNVETALLGGDITSAEVMSSLKKADLSLRLLMQIRNKLLSSYDQLQQMRF